jgi:hypothetical protein
MGARMQGALSKMKKYFLGGRLDTLDYDRLTLLLYITGEVKLRMPRTSRYATLCLGFVENNSIRITGK